MRNACIALLIVALIILGATAFHAFTHGTTPLVLWVSVLCAAGILNLVRKTR